MSDLDASASRSFDVGEKTVREGVDEKSIYTSYAQLARGLAHEIAALNAASGLSFNPDQIETKFQKGSGALSYTFSLSSGGLFIPVYMRVHYTAGTSIDDLIVSVNSATGFAEYDAVLFTHKDRGNGFSSFIRIPVDEYNAWTIGAGDEVQLDWADSNADSDWGISVGMLPGEVV